MPNTSATTFATEYGQLQTAGLLQLKGFEMLTPRTAAQVFDSCVALYTVETLHRAVC